MARRLAADTNVTRLHNVKARQDAIRDSLERLYQLDAQIAGIIEAEIAGLREEKTDIKKTLRQDYQMPAKLVAARYASYRLERDAQQAKDDSTLDAIREMFEALPIGGSVDLFAEPPARRGRNAAAGAEERDGA